MKDGKPAPSVLVVEDEPIVCEMLRTVIRRKVPDATVYLAENGRQGVDLFREHAPDIVITDINMPVMDGIEMAALIKEIDPDTPFIVITAYSDKAYYQRFSEIGFSDYLLKPVEFPKLFSAIDKCLEKCRGNGYLSAFTRVSFIAPGDHS